MSHCYSLLIRISRITAFAQWQPFVDGPYTCSGNRSADGFDSTIIKVETDAGVTGWGEMAPLGAFYDPSFVGGARAGTALLAPLLIGKDPCQPARLNRLMDLQLNGHPYAKSAIDMGLWDIAAQSAGQPLAEALGGRYGHSVDLYRSISQASPQTMAATAKQYVERGYRRLQVKVGLDPDEDVERMHAVLDMLPPGIVVFADANGSWLPSQARRFLRATQHLDFTMEQPCASYDNNLAIRAACDRPLVLDETIDSLATLLRALGDHLVDGITIKLARVGGITKARLIRDVAVDAGLLVTVEDTGGAQIDTAAMAHISLSTPEGARTHTVDFHHWVSVANGTADLHCKDGAMTAPTIPGLGVNVDEAALGTPIFVAS